MIGDTIRNAPHELALRELSKVLCVGLGVDRAAVLQLNEDKTGYVQGGVYVAATDGYAVPLSARRAGQLEAMLRVSARGIVAIDDVNRPNQLHELRELVFRPNNIRGILHAPVNFEGRLVAFITGSTVGRTFTWTSEHKLFAASIANLAALVLERQERRAAEAAALASAERLSRQQEALNDLMRDETICTGDLAQAFRKIAKLLSGEMRLDRVGFILFSDGKAHPVHSEVYVTAENRFVLGQNAYMDGYPAPMAHAILDGAFTIEDCINHPLTAPVYDALLRSKDIRSVIHAPIVLDGKLAGIVQCTVCGGKRTWAPEDVALATGVANLVALVRERNLRFGIEGDLRTAKLAAEAASRAKSMFLANMSHEIRTPMNGVFGMTELLSRSQLTERQRRLVGTIGQSAQTLLTIINDILDLSRIEEGQFKLDEHEFELHSCVEDAVAVMTEDAHRKGLDLNLFIDERAVACVNGDAVRLRQVLINLIGNAVKFTAAGAVTVRVVPTTDDNGCAQLSFCVQDTGIGIAADVPHRLFQPFTQADNSISRRFGGTGLGLSISRHLVALMGGAMTLESTPGKGTSISFCLPMSLQPVAGASRRGVAISPAGCRILVVGERETNREIVCSYLAAAGAEPVPACSGSHALSLLAAAAADGTPFAIAVVDLVMPDTDGIQLCRRIKSEGLSGHMRLILLSSLSWRGEEAAVREAGIDRLLSKPIRRQELVGTVAELVTTRTARATGKPCASCSDPPIRKLGLRVVVAEDNPVNQLVVGEYLANLGCTVATVDNGVQAVAALERETFSIVLMDCQMPEMDGLTATRHIRDRERGLGLARTPIVAVTANAFYENRKICLTAGMDGYLSKPFSEGELAAALTQWAKAAVPAETPVAQVEKRAPRKSRTPNAPVPKSARASKSTKASRKRPARPAVGSPASVDDQSNTLSDWRTPPRPGLQQKLLQTYLGYAPAAVEALLNGLERGDCLALRLVAHSLESSSANVGEVDITALCGRLEAAAGNGGTSDCRPLVAEIQRAVDA